MRGRRTRATTKAVKRTAFYIRCSTAEQAVEGVSLSVQESRLRSFADATARSVDDVVIDDGYSAKDLNRPGIARLLEDVRAGVVGTVVVLKLDRITRSVRDLGTMLDVFAKADAALVSVTESLDTKTAAGRMVTNMLGVVAQWERETIGERTADAHADKRRKGRVYSGRSPFGYRATKDKRLVADPKKQPALDLIRTMHANGEGASLRMIAKTLTDRRIAPPRGKQWYASSVKAIIDSRMYQDRAA